jgi:hypothetical protein
MSFTEPRIKTEIGSKMNVDMGCTTLSEVPARKVSCNVQFSTVPVNSSHEMSTDVETNVINLFHATLKLKPMNERPSLTKGEIARASSLGSDFSKEMDEALKSKTVIILVVGELTFTDDAGLHKSEYCRWTFDEMPRFWHFCHSHDRVAY